MESVIVEIRAAEGESIQDDIYKAIMDSGGSAWASDISKMVGVTTQTVRKYLYQMDYLGIIEWKGFPSNPARINVKRKKENTATK